jgi:hypothetical protein
MCEFEQNILKLLLEEKERLKPLVNTQIPLPYFKSLEHGIESAKKKLAECEERKCIADISKQTEIIPQLSLQYWANRNLAVNQCKKQG